MDHLVWNRHTALLALNISVNHLLRTAAAENKLTGKSPDVSSKAVVQKKTFPKLEASETLAVSGSNQARRSRVLKVA